MKSRRWAEICFLISLVLLLAGIALRQAWLTRLGSDMSAFFFVIWAYVLLVRRLRPRTVISLTLIGLFSSGVLFYLGEQSERAFCLPLLEGLSGGLLYLIFMTSSDTGQEIIRERQVLMSMESEDKRLQGHRCDISTNAGDEQD